jgi:hypothetical protein
VTAEAGLLRLRDEALQIAEVRLPERRESERD